MTEDSPDEELSLAYILDELSATRKALKDKVWSVDLVKQLIEQDNLTPSDYIEQIKKYGEKVASK